MDHVVIEADRPVTDDEFWRMSKEKQMWTATEEELQVTINLHRSLTLRHDVVACYAAHKIMELRYRKLAYEHH